MRFRPLLTLSLATMLLSTAPAAFAGHAPTTDAGDHGAIRAKAADFPHVARNQQRPLPRAAACVDCEELPPFDDGGYVAGGCNCRRNCTTDNTGCTLGTNNQCKGTIGGGCTNCVNVNCG